jgi:DNA-directed RNA polymerase specialized sigma24 family protein
MDHLQPQLIEILSRYRIPLPDAEEMLEQLFLTLYMRDGTLESPDRWLLLSLKNRCLIYWRNRRERLCRKVDNSLLTMLSSPQVSDSEKTGMRRFLEQALTQLPEGCRARLERRYGLCDGEEPSPGDPTAAELRPCLEALTRTLVGKNELRDEIASDA